MIIVEFVIKFSKTIQIYFKSYSYILNNLKVNFNKKNSNLIIKSIKKEIVSSHYYPNLNKLIFQKVNTMAFFKTF